MAIEVDILIDDCRAAETGVYPHSSPGSVADSHCHALPEPDVHSFDGFGVRGIWHPARRERDSFFARPCRADSECHIDFTILLGPFGRIR